MGIFDAARWHREIPHERAGTHIAMYVGWCVTRRLISPAHEADPCAGFYLDGILRMERSPRDFLVDLLDDQLTEDDLSGEGLEFTTAYYDRYLADYSRCFASSVYDVPDGWETLARISVILDRRLAQFRRWRAQQGEVVALIRPDLIDTDVTATAVPPR
jgi:hypothetical protein